MLFFALSLLATSLLITRSETGPIVTTTYGDVEGKLLQDVNEFLGVPYAKAERFSHPQAYPSWSGVYNATEKGASCPQLPAGGPFNVIGRTDENCLFLNIFTPKAATDNTNFAVMVWIHGGAFKRGSANAPLYSGSVYASSHDVIVVTVNYRLGVLGYLNIPGTDVKGNYGVRDQIFALKWIRDNIKSFGGNPNKVTIFGESAGASSASILLLSPLAKNLFHRAIFQSGSSTWPEIAERYGDVKTLEKVAEKINCPMSSKTALVKCLKKKTAEEIVQGQAAEGLVSRFATPRVDGEVIPDFPEKLLRDGKFTKVPCIIGFNKDEGAVFIKSTLQNLGINTSTADQGIPAPTLQRIINDKFHHEGQPVLDAVMFEYKDRSCSENDCLLLNRQLAVDAIGDYQFYSTADYEARMIAASGTPVYYYWFTYPSVWADFSDWLKPTHGSDVEFVFGRPLDSDGYSENDKKFSKIIMSAWARFAKYGDPNNVEVTWPQFATKSDTNRSQYIEFNKQLKVGQFYRAHKMAFWNEYVPLLRLKNTVPAIVCSSTCQETQVTRHIQFSLPIALAVWLRF